MPLTPQNNRQIVELFGFLGFLWGFIFPGIFAERMFYTTKPYALIHGWVFFVLAILFGASFAMIPLATVTVQRSSPDIRYRSVLLVLAAFWALMVALTSVVVSLVTATVHHKTSDIPGWLIPAGLFLVAVLPGITVLLAGLWKAGRYERCG